MKLSMNFKDFLWLIFKFSVSFYNTKSENVKRNGGYIHNVIFFFLKRIRRSKHREKFPKHMLYFSKSPLVSLSFRIF